MNRWLLRLTDTGGSGGSWSSKPGGVQAFETADTTKTAKIGLGLFLVVVTSLFFLFLIAFIARSQVADWQPLTAPLAPLANPWPLWLNTALLGLSSMALQWARMAARRGDQGGTVTGFALGGLFTMAFLAGQLWVWQQFVAADYFVATNPANSFFYLLTGLHGLHLLGGLVAWSRTAAKLFPGVRRRMPLQQVRTSVELCALYWHYLLGLWLVLFALLTSTPATYAAIAAFCGLR